MSRSSVVALAIVVGLLSGPACTGVPLSAVDGGRGQSTVDAGEGCNAGGIRCGPCGTCVQAYASEAAGVVSAYGIAYARDDRAIGRVIVAGKVAELEHLHPRSWTVSLDATEVQSLPRDADGRALLSIVTFDADGAACAVGMVTAVPEEGCMPRDAGVDASVDGGEDANVDEVDAYVEEIDAYVEEIDAYVEEIDAGT